MSYVRCHISLVMCHIDQNSPVHPDSESQESSLSVTYTAGAAGQYFLFLILESELISKGHNLWYGLVLKLDGVGPADNRPSTD